MDMGREIENALTEAFAGLENAWDEHRPEQRISVEDELRLLALEGLMETNPERAMSYLQRYLTDDHPLAARRQALFVLAHSDYVAAGDVLGDVIARSDDAELRGEALRLAGLALEPAQASELLLGVYDSLDSPRLRQRAIEGLALADDADGLVAVFSREPAGELRARIVRQLGELDAVAALQDLYRREADPDVRLAMLDGFAIAGDARMLAEIAVAAEDAEIAERAVRAMAVAGADSVPAATLEDLYRRHRDDRSLRDAVADTLAAIDGGESLLALFREARDADERTMLMKRLRAVGGDAAEEVFVEILEDTGGR